jgi:tRNA(Ile)-lysidine synthase
MIYHNPSSIEDKGSFSDFFNGIKLNIIYEKIFESHKELFSKKSIIAYSGGKDSSLLLHLYYYFVKQKQIPLPILFHLNHKIRNNSNQELAIEKFMNSTPFQIHVISKNVPEIAKRFKKSLEETGRILRYKELQKIAKKEKALIVTGHHTIDYLESILINFIRGAGESSLRTLQILNGNLFRPLILLEEGERKKLTQDLSLPLFEDESNHSRNFLRNRLRQDVIVPLLREGLNPQKLYFNFHEKDLDEKNHIIKNHNYYKISSKGIEGFSITQLKALLDIYLKQLGVHPIQKKIVTEIYSQMKKGKIVLQENSEVLYWKSPKSDLYILLKNSSCFRYGTIHKGLLKWNEKEIPIDSSYHLRFVEKGLKIHKSGHTKEVSELFREREIPPPIRIYFPICFQNSKLKWIPFRLWDDKIKDFYGD